MMGGMEDDKFDDDLTWGTKSQILQIIQESQL